MKQEYVVFKKTNKEKAVTMFPKRSQTPKRITYLVKKEFAGTFSKFKSTSMRVMYSDLVFADGVLVKNIFGPTP